MRVKYADLIALFVQLGFKTADKWPLQRVKDRAAKIDTVADAETKLDGDARMTKLYNALKKKGDQLEITDLPDDAEDDDATTATAAEPADDDAPATKGKGAAKKAAGKKATTTKTSTAKAAPKKAAGKKTATTKTAKGKTAKKKAAGDAKENEPGMGVHDTKSRPYVAGFVIKKHGLDHGVTKEMAAEVDKLYGRANPRESLFCLRNAWHAIRAYTKGDIKLGKDAKAE